MNLADAIEEVLTEATAPMHYVEITDTVIGRGRWSTDGDTPERTVNSTLTRDIKDKGDKSRFTQIGRGIYGLRNREYRKVPLEVEVARRLSFIGVTEEILKELKAKNSIKKL